MSFGSFQPVVSKVVDEGAGIEDNVPTLSRDVEMVEGGNEVEVALSVP